MEKLLTNLQVQVDKSVWYQFRLIAEHKELTKDQAFEEALSDYIRKNKKYDTMKLSEGT